MAPALGSDRTTHLKRVFLSTESRQVQYIMACVDPGFSESARRILSFVDVLGSEQANCFDI